MVRGRKNPAHYLLPLRLRQARRRLGLTPAATSLASGLSNEAVTQIERRQRLPRIGTIEQLAACLQVSAAWLAFGEGNADRDPSAMGCERVGQRIAELRQAQGMTRKALGAASQLAGQAIANIEQKGMLPRVDALERIAKALGVSPGWLAFGTAHAAAEQRPQHCA
ncbi:MAG: helix-turn-helix domain-containing protein [Myxococcales bacterium]|nr:helix-turn-helix domain-containing protein [Myxococcales bacterium]